MSILTPPLSKRGILKALGQDPSKSDVLTVSTNSAGGIASSRSRSVAADGLRAAEQAGCRLTPEIT